MSRRGLRGRIDTTSLAGSAIARRHRQRVISLSGAGLFRGVTWVTVLRSAEAYSPAHIGRADGRCVEQQEKIMIKITTNHQDSLVPLEDHELDSVSGGAR